MPSLSRQGVEESHQSVATMDDSHVPSHLGDGYLAGLQLAKQIGVGSVGTVWMLKDRHGVESASLVFKQLAGNPVQQQRLLQTMSQGYGVTQGSVYPVAQRQQDVSALANITDILGLPRHHTGRLKFSDLEKIVSPQCIVHLKSGTKASVAAFKDAIPYLNREVGVPMVIGGKFGLLMNRVNEFTSFENIGQKINPSNPFVMQNVRSVLHQLSEFLRACKSAGVMHWDFHCQNFGITGSLDRKNGCTLAVIDVDSVSPSKVLSDGRKASLSDPMVEARLLAYFLECGLMPAVQSMIESMPNQSEVDVRCTQELQVLLQDIRKTHAAIKDAPQEAFPMTIQLLQSHHCSPTSRLRSYAFSVNQ